MRGSRPTVAAFRAGTEGEEITRPARIQADPLTRLEGFSRATHAGHPIQLVIRASNLRYHSLETGALYAAGG